MYRVDHFDVFYTHDNKNWSTSPSNKNERDRVGMFFNWVIISTI